MNVYLYPSNTETELKNAYIGEVYEYGYTFKGKTAAQIGNDWDLKTGTLQTNSDGVCGSSSDDCRLGFNIPNLANAKKITILGTVVVNSLFPINNASFFGISVGSGWGTGEAINKVEGANFNGCYVTVNTNGAIVNGNSIGNTTQGTYTQKLTIDLENKTMVGSVSGFNNSTINLTDAQITEIRTFTYLVAYVSLNYSAISDISLTIE